MATRPIAALVVFTVALASPAAEPPKPKFKLGKDTTFVTEPLDKDGYIDYETALNERLRGKIKPEDNAVVLLVQVCGPKPEGAELHADVYKWLGTKPSPEKGEYLVRDSTFFRDEYRADDTRSFFDLESRLRRTPWKAKDHPKFAEWLKVNEKPLEFAVEASKRNSYFCPIVSRTKTGKRGTILGAGASAVRQSVREFASLLTTRAMLRLGEGLTTEAWQDLIAVHRLGRLTAGGGTLIDLLVGVAVEAIATNAELVFVEVTAPTVQQITQYQNDLRKLPPAADIPRVIDSAERAATLDMIQLFQRDGLSLLERLMSLRQDRPAISMWLLDRFGRAVVWSAVLRKANKWFDRYVRVARMTDHAARRKAWIDIGVEFEALKAEATQFSILKRGILTGNRYVMLGTWTATVGNIILLALQTPYEKINSSVDRYEQQHHNLHLAFALAAYHADHKQYPAALADLAPMYIEQVPTDLFAGKPLVYKPSDTGYLLYSVGVNGTDDGGKTYGDDPPGDDLRVRMPSVKPK